MAAQTMKRKLKHALLRPFSQKHALKYRAQKEAAQWQREGYNYRELWRYHAVFIEETGSVYIAVSKAANSAVRRALSDSSFYECFNPERNARHGIHQFKALNKTLGDIAAENMPAFTVVRHPVERFWSAYQNKIIDHPDYGIAGKVARFHGLPAGEKNGVTPEMVLDHMEQIPVHQVDEHLRPQWACCGLGRIPFKMVAKVENLEDDLADAVRQGLFPRQALDRLKVSNPSKKKVAPADREQLRSRIESYYAKDFEAFGY